MRSACLALLATFALAACADAAGEATADSSSAATDESAEDVASIIAKDLDPETLAAAEANGVQVGDPNADFDQDGIADVLEEQLLRRYRPFYKFAKEGNRIETNRAADPVTELEHAQLKMMKGDDAVSGPITECGRADDHLLAPAASLYECKPEVSLQTSRAESNYCLDITDDRHGGVSAEEAKEKSTGFFGHVTKDTINGHDAYKLEYWQFFAFNNQDITVFGLGSFGDHQGDWTGLELWYDLTTNTIVKMEYLIHGYELVFNVPADTAATCTSCFQTVKGSHYDPNVGSFFDDKQRPKYDDNQAELWNDEAGTMHTVLYVERGGHEGWPGPWGKAEINLGIKKVTDNAHNGLGENYLVNSPTDRPINLGEIDHPLTTNARMILEFNGHWGCTNVHDVYGKAPQRRSPPGPGTHCEWHMPDGSDSISGCEN